MNLVIVSNTSVAASDIANQLEYILENNPNILANIGVYILEIDIISTCTDQGVCTCSGNFIGPNCDVEALCPNNCTYQGNCTIGRYSMICDCYDGYSGIDCSVVACPNDCSGHGACSVVGSEGICSCSLPWNGTACDISLGAGCQSNCSNLGICNNNTCGCLDGRTGEDCSIEFIVSTAGPVAPTTTDTKALVASVVVVGVIVIAFIGFISYVVYRRRQHANRIFRI